MRGMITAAEPPVATNDETEAIELLILLDDDAGKNASNELAKIRHLYEIEDRKRGKEVMWFRPVEALLNRRVEPDQLIFTLPGVQVFELKQDALFCCRA
jgi:hypothetical protein